MNHRLRPERHAGVLQVVLDASYCRPAAAVLTSGDAHLKVVITPVPDREYPVQAHWRGETHVFQIAFSRRFCAQGAQVDLAESQLRMRDGSVHDALGARAAFETLTGVQAPPWLFRVPRGGFALPRGLLRVDVHNERVAIEVPAQCTPIFTCYEGTAEPTSPPLEPAETVQLKLAASVRIQAPGWPAAKRAKHLFESIFGAGFAAIRPGIADDISIIVAAGDIAEVRELAAYDLTLPSAPDAHGVSATTSGRFSAVTLRTPKRRLVCANIADEAGLIHELYHLLEHEVLDPRWLDAYYHRTVSRAGPFARPYGYLRKEFLPTLGELLHLDPAWMRQHHRPLVDWLQATRSAER